MRFMIYDLRSTGCLRKFGRGAIHQMALVCAAVVLFHASAWSAELLLRGGTIHTVTHGVFSPGDVLIRDGKIAAVGPAISETNGAEVIELHGAHVFPGLIDLNTELGLVEIGAVRSTHDEAEVGDYTPEVESWIAINPDSELLPVARANGVAYFEATPRGGIVAGQSGLVALQGWTYEEMTIRKPAALHVYWPNMSLDLTPKERAADKAKWKSPEDQARERRAKIRALEDFFAEASAYARAKIVARTNTTLSPELTPAWEAMLPFVQGELPIVVHANDVREIHAAVNWARTNHYAIAIADARDAWMSASLLASNQIPVIYGAVFTQPARETDSYDAPFRAPSILSAAGVKVSLNESGSMLVKNLPYAAAQAVAHGLPRDEALKAITLHPAQVLRVADRLGSIEPGKEATLFIADGDIFDIRSNVQRMWIAGREVRLENRHTRLFEKYKNRPRPQ